MFTRRFSLVSISAVICFVLLAAEGVSAGSFLNWWHNLMQSQRNAHIIARAQQDVGVNVQQSCKEWVRTVVLNASGNTVTIPPNSSNDTRWQSHSYCRRYAPPVSMANFRVGYIIQMRWRNQNGVSNPHTAIILSRTSSGMDWIESNWQGDQTVRIRHVSFSQFNQAVGSNYSVYKIE